MLNGVREGGGHTHAFNVFEAFWGLLRAGRPNFRHGGWRERWLWASEASRGGGVVHALYVSRLRRASLTARGAPCNAPQTSVNGRQPPQTQRTLANDAPALFHASPIYNSALLTLPRFDARFRSQATATVLETRSLRPLQRPVHLLLLTPHANRSPLDSTKSGIRVPLA